MRVSVETDVSKLWHCHRPREMRLIERQDVQSPERSKAKCNKMSKFRPDVLMAGMAPNGLGATDDTKSVVMSHGQDATRLRDLPVTHHR